MRVNLQYNSEFHTHNLVSKDHNYIIGPQIPPPVFRLILMLLHKHQTQFKDFLSLYIYFSTFCHLNTVLAPFGKICRVRRILRVCEYIAEWCICVPKNQWGKISLLIGYEPVSITLRLELFHAILVMDAMYTFLIVIKLYITSILFFTIEKIPNSPNPNGRIRSIRHSRTRWMPTLGEH